ncbi:MAG: hypothetical protein R2834_12155 [Rhodothermales bacterium]
MASRVYASLLLARSTGACLLLAIVGVALLGCAGYSSMYSSMYSSAYSSVAEPQGGAVAHVHSPTAPVAHPTWRPLQDDTSSSGSEEKRVESTSYRTRPDLAWHPSLAQRIARLTAARASDDAHVGLVEAVLSLHRLLHIYRI